MFESLLGPKMRVKEGIRKLVDALLEGLGAYPWGVLSSSLITLSCMELMHRWKGRVRRVFNNLWARNLVFRFELPPTPGFSPCNYPATSTKNGTLNFLFKRMYMLSLKVRYIESISVVQVDLRWPLITHPLYLIKNSVLQSGWNLLNQQMKRTHKVYSSILTILTWFIPLVKPIIAAKR